jgi:hypothetical protein
MNRRAFIAVAVAPLAAARTRSQAQDRFAAAWERYKASLERQWQRILALNERVKLHRAGTYDAQVSEICEEIGREARAQDAELKALCKG